MALKFQNPNHNILCKIAFWSKQKWLNKELINEEGRPGKQHSPLSGMGQPIECCSEHAHI